MADVTFLIEIIVRARREMAGAMEKATREVEKLTGAEEKHARASKKVGDATDTTRTKVEKLTREYNEYVSELEAGNREAENAEAHLKRFGQEFERLSRRSDAGSKAADELLRASRAAKQLADDIARAQKARAAQIEESYKQAAQVDKAYEDLEKARIEGEKKAQAERDRGLRNRQAFVLELLEEARKDEQKRARDRAEIDRAEQDDFERVSAGRVERAQKTTEEEVAAARNRQKLLQEILDEVHKDEEQRARAREDIRRSEEEDFERLTAARVAAVEEREAAELKATEATITRSERERLADIDRRAAQRDLRDEIDETIRRYDDFIDRVRQGDVVGRDVRVGLVQHARALGGAERRATTAFGAGSREATVVGGRAEESREIIRDLGRESDDADVRVRGLTGSLQRLFNIDSSRVRALRDEVDRTDRTIGRATFGAIRFAGVIRSLVYVGAIIFFQELTSAAIALAGALVAVASTAVQAGVALVGSLAAGAAQALPVIGLLGAAWGRVGAVFKAVQQNIKQQTQATHDNSQAAERNREASNRVADAQDRVRAARQALNLALREGRRQWEDLIAAERSAELQARRSSLAQGEAQNALNAALRQGDIGAIPDLQLRVDETREAVRGSGTARDRAREDAATARRQGPAGLPGVQAARRSLEEAREDLKEVRVEARLAVAEVSAADRTLQQMLANLSPAERRLYETLNRVVTRYREVFAGEGGILEPIVDSVTFGAERVLVLLEDARIIRAARDLADEIATQFERVFAGLTGREGQNFIASLADDARRTLPLFTELAVQVGRITAAIVQAGGPALTRFLDFLVGLATAGSEATGSDSGIARLTEFFLKGEEYAEDITTLVLAVLELFAALGGIAAPEGQSAIEAITNSIRQATEYIRDNKDDVRQFFRDALTASAAIGRAIGALAVGLFSLFRSEHVQTFADAFTKTLLPALLTVMRVIGFVTNLFLKFAGTGPGSAMIQFLIIFGGVSKILGPIVGLFIRLGRAIGLFLGMARVVAFFNGLLLLLGPIGLAIVAIGTALFLLNKKLNFVEKFRDLFVSASDKAKKAADAFTDSINRQIEALRRARDAEVSRQNSRLALSRAEIAVTRARRDVEDVEKRIRSGELKGSDAIDARREASLNLKQAILDEKQARQDLTDARKTEREEEQKAVTVSKDAITRGKERVSALRDEKTEIENRIDSAKREIDLAKELLDKQVPGTRDYTIAQEQLKEAQDKLRDAQSDLRGNTRDLRIEAQRADLAFRRWRNAVRRAGGGTERFSDDVHSAMESIKNDVNEVLREFGFKELRFSAKRRPSKSTQAGPEVPFGVTDPGGISGFQRGGIIPGEGDGDTVPVLAEPGEGFINKAAVAWLGGKRAIDAINARIPRFQEGGFVQGAIADGLSPQALSFARRMFKLGFSVTSAFRPGDPRQHGQGMALDFGDSVNDLTKLGRILVPLRGRFRQLLGPSGLWNGIMKFSDPGLQANHRDHWHVGFAGAVGKFSAAAGALAEVARRQVSGPAGALKNIFQGAADRVVKAANTFLVRQTADTGETSESGDKAGQGAAAPAQVRAWARTALEFTGRFSPSNLRALVGRIMQESGGDPNITQKVQDINSQRGDPAVGLAQVIGSTFAAYRDKRLPNDRRNPIANLVAAIRYMIARYGHIVGPTGRGYAAGGVVSGLAGQAVPIIAHAKEWVVNKAQQMRLAERMGTTVDGVRSMLGFGGGPESFAGGGEVKPFTVSRDLGLGLGETFKEVERAGKTIARLRSSLINSKATDALTKSFGALLGDGGLFDLLSESVQRLSTTLEDRLQSLVFKVDKSGNIVRRLTPLQVAERSVENLRKVYEALNQEAFTIDRELQRVNQRLGGRLSKGERRRLEAVKTNLEKRLGDVNKSIIDNVQAQFEAVEQVIQASVDAAQSTFDAASFANSIQGRSRAIAGPALSAALGLPSPLQIQQAQAAALNAQADAVQGASELAARRGHTETARALQQQVVDLRVQATEAIAQGLRDQVSVIEAAASRQQSRIDLSGRAADLLERVGNTAGAFALRGQNLVATGENLANQRARLAGQLAFAQAAGQGAVAEELADKIAELDQQLAQNTVAIQENTTAARAAAIQAITDRGGFLGGVFGGIGSIFNSLAELSGVTNTGGILAALRGAGTTLAQTGAGLRQQLAEAFGIDLRGLSAEQTAQALLGVNFDAIEAGLTPDQKTQFRDLINSIIENTTATVDNTKQIQDLTQPDAQSFSSTAWQMFRRAVFTGSGGLLPQFSSAVPSLNGGGMIIREGYAYLHPGEVYNAAQVARDGGSNGKIADQIIVQTTQPTVMYDPTNEARQLAVELRRRRR